MAAFSIPKLLNCLTSRLDKSGQMKAKHLKDIRYAIRIPTNPYTLSIRDEEVEECHFGGSDAGDSFRFFNWIPLGCIYTYDNRDRTPTPFEFYYILLFYMILCRSR